MTNQNNNCTNCQIVRDYVDHIEDEQIRLMCFLWSKGYSDDTVKRRMKLSWPRLRELKSRISKDLIAAGVKLRS
jgi:hypothetical protein